MNREEKQEIGEKKAQKTFDFYKEMIAKTNADGWYYKPATTGKWAVQHRFRLTNSTLKTASKVCYMDEIGYSNIEDNAHASKLKKLLENHFKKD